MRGKSNYEGMNKQVFSNNAGGASPQKENGYTPVANEILEQLAKLSLTSREWRTLLALWRKTWGWHKKEDKISMTQFEKMTGIERRNQSRTLKSLIAKNIIYRKETRPVITYGFQKDYTEWVAIVSSDTSVFPDNRVLYGRTTKPLSQPTPTKEIKETIQKKGENSPIRDIIRIYKMKKGYDSQLDWDKYHYKDHVAQAKQLYEVAGEEWQPAMEWLSKQGYSWALKTVTKKFPDYKVAKGRKRMLGAAGRLLWPI